MAAQTPEERSPEVPLSAASLWPARLTSELSAWNEHVPFAGWIVEAVAPDVLVELGTHAGVSYFAFCESVRRLDLGTRCFAVDTWLGDEHSGSYGEEIYESVEALNAEFYGSFSRLIRSTFDEAVEEFENGSIDLLHIDGLHTYEAVRHDFETWLPKLSSRAVVLLHDTGERKDDFGVHRLFAELAAQYSTFEFSHGHGLGVVAVGAEIPAAVEALVALDDGSHATRICDLYAALGQRLNAELAERRLADALEESTEELGRVHEELERVHEVLSRKDDELGRLHDSLATKEERLEQHRVLTADAYRRAEVARADAQSKGEEVAQVSAHTDAQQKEIKQLKGDLSKSRKAYQGLRNRRSVRFVLRLAALFQPLFKVVRRAKKGPTPAAPVIVRSAREKTGKGRPTGGGGPAPRWDGQAPTGLCTIIVPIFNAHDEVERCLRSIVRNTTGETRLLLIDDASTDDRITTLLADYGRLATVDVLTNEENLGFGGTVNRGFETSSGDVVVLNSDVEVPPGWLQRLRLAAHSDPKVGTVTALSDNAGAFSAPEFATANPVPMAVTHDQLGRGVAQGARGRYARSPTANGFCMLIRRDCLDDVGLFDAKAFPRGYGEENDFCMRALRAGWLNLVDSTTFVLHAGSASFGEDRHELMRAGTEVLKERYPEYERLVGDFVTSDEMVTARTSIGDTFEELGSGKRRPRPRLLFVLHDGGGGTPAITEDLIGGLDQTYEAFVLISNGEEVRLEGWNGDGTEELFRERLQPSIRPDDLTHRDYREIASGVMVRYAIDVVHIHHLIGHSGDVPRLARALGIPVVLSLHDFYYVCPTVHLIDNEGRFCGGACTSGQGECPVPTAWLRGLPHLKHEWVYEWRERSLDMFDNIDAFVIPSHDTMSYYLGVFPELATRRFEIIEHGQDKAITTPAVGVPVDAGGKVRILLPGHLDPHKGSLFVRRLAELDSERRLEFHVLGRVDPALDGLVVDHGTYARGEFAELARQIAPAFVGLFSTTAESHSFVLSESWSAGIPVLASNLGALQERIDRHGGGWTVDINDPAGAYQRILEIADDREGYAVRLAMTREAAAALRTIDEMAFDYATLYGELRQQRQSFPVELGAGHPVLRVGAFMPRGEDGSFTAASHIRIIRRLDDPSLADHVVWNAADADRFLTTEVSFDVAVVQRNAISSSLVDDFVDRCRRAGIPILFDLDDNLLNDDPAWVERNHYQPYRHSIETLAAAASVITVSTPALADRMAEYNAEVVVLPNALDQSLWFRSFDSDLRLPEMPATKNGELRLVYFGGPTHGGDLEIIKPALDLVRGTLGRDAHLSVIGGVSKADRSAWFRSVKIPGDRGLYPRFATWVQSLRSGFDIGLAPLEDTPLNRHKSDLRFLEYGAIGFPGVYSKAEAFATVEDGVTGLVVDNTPEVWSEAIVRLWQDAELRGGIRRRAFEYIADERLISQQSDEYLALLLSAISTKR